MMTGPTQGTDDLYGDKYRLIFAHNCTINGIFHTDAWLVTERQEGSPTEDGAIMYGSYRTVLEHPHFDTRAKAVAWIDEREKAKFDPKKWVNPNLGRMVERFARSCNAKGRICDDEACRPGCKEECPEMKRCEEEWTACPGAGIEGKPYYAGQRVCFTGIGTGDAKGQLCPHPDQCRSKESPLYAELVRMRSAHAKLAEENTRLEKIIGNAQSILKGDY